MDKDPYKRLANQRPRSLYMAYLWSHGCYRELVTFIGKRINAVLLTCAWAWILCLVVVALFVFQGSLAGGTNEQQIMIQMVREINSVIGIYEKAYQDISRLAGKVESKGKQPEDRAFLYAFLITKYARAYGFNPEDVAGLIFHESQFKTTAHSDCDAHGLMQIHVPTWGSGDWFHPETNIKKGVQILYMYRNSNPQTYLKRYGGWPEGEGEHYVQAVRASQRLFR